MSSATEQQTAELFRAEEMPVHPAAALFPMMTDEELEKLAADIREQGLLHPIITYRGEVLDGRNRIEACRRKGIPFTTKEYDGNDPVGFVIAANIHRRHLNTSQRASIADDLARMKPGDPASQKDDSGNQLSQAEAARCMKVSVASVKEARAAKAEATPEELEALKAGKVSVNKLRTKQKARKKGGKPPSRARVTKSLKDVTPKPETTEGDPDDADTSTEDDPPTEYASTVAADDMAALYEAFAPIVAAAQALKGMEEPARDMAIRKNASRLAGALEDAVSVANEILAEIRS